MDQAYTPQAERCGSHMPARRVRRLRDTAPRRFMTHLARVAQGIWRSTRLHPETSAAQSAHASAAYHIDVRIDDMAPNPALRGKILVLLGTPVAHGSRFPGPPFQHKGSPMPTITPTTTSPH